MARSLANCHTKLRKMDQNRCRVEPRTYHIERNTKKSRKTSQEMEDDLNEFVKDEETETTQNDDLKNSNT